MDYYLRTDNVTKKIRGKGAYSCTRAPDICVSLYLTGGIQSTAGDLGGRKVAPVHLRQRRIRKPWRRRRRRRRRRSRSRRRGVVGSAGWRISYLLAGPLRTSHGLDECLWSLVLP